MTKENQLWQCKLQQNLRYNSHDVSSTSCSEHHCDQVFRHSYQMVCTKNISVNNVIYTSITESSWFLFYCPFSKSLVSDYVFGSNHFVTDINLCVQS